MADGVRIGEVTHFYNNISVAVVQLTEDLELGDTVHFLGRHTDFRQPVASMQIDKEAVESCSGGHEVAIKVQQRTRRGDSVFKLSPS